MDICLNCIVIILSRDDRKVMLLLLKYNAVKKYKVVDMTISSKIWFHLLTSKSDQEANVIDIITED